MNRPTFIYPTHIVTGPVTATDTALNYAAANVLEGCEDTAWKPANTTGSKSIIITMGGELPVGQVGILGNYLNGVTLEVRGSTDGFVASDVELSAAAAISTSTFITTYRRFTEGLYTHIKLIFSGHSASFEVQHIACCRAVSLPYLEDGHDPDAFNSNGGHLIGSAGTYLGATQQNSMFTISLDFGQLLTAQYAPFQHWADYCVRTIRPFFYVPDIDQTACYFGWTEAKYKFSAPSKTGSRRLAPIPFTGRRA